MTCRAITAAVLAASLLAGGAEPAMAQQAPALRGSLVEDAAAEADAAAAPVRKRVRAELAETNLDIAPLEPQATESAAIVPLEPPPPPRRKAVVEDPYAPTGIGNTGIRFFPAITAGTIFSSNVNESKNDPESATGLQLRPSLRVESNWVRHSLTAGLDGNLVSYAGKDAYDTRTLDLFQRLRLDVRRHTTATLDTRYALDQPGGEESTEHTLSGSAALIQDFGPVVATLRTGLTGRFFEDVKLEGGGTQSNSDRDYIEPSVALRAAYNQPQAIRPYIEASYAPRFHKDEIDRNGLARDSQGFGLTAGIEIAAEPLWTGDLGLTYLHRNYKDNSLDSASAFGLSGSVTWSPTDLTTVVMEAGTSLGETTVASASASTTWTASADVTHALRDNLDLLAGASVEIEDVDGSADKTYDASLGLSWKLNPILSWTAAYDLTWLDAGAGGEDYVEHRVSTGVTVSR
jgi:hypothetical protein